MKVATRGKDVKGTLFDIPPGCANGKLLRLRELRLDATVPHVYDRFIGAWGIFPQHDQATLYFPKHVYVRVCARS